MGNASVEVPSASWVEDIHQEVRSIERRLRRLEQQESTPTPPAQPAPKGPVWRKMTELATHYEPVLVMNVRSGVVDAYVRHKGRWAWYGEAYEGDDSLKIVSFDDDDRWLDLNGFTPEVSE